MGFFGSDIEMAVKHSLSPTEVIHRLEANLTEKMQAAFPEAQLTNLRQQWNGSAGTFSCTVDGNDISGKMSVNSTQLRVEVDLPFGAGLVVDKDEMKDAVRAQITALLS